jgi:hypothetical protein
MYLQLAEDEEQCDMLGRRTRAERKTRRQEHMDKVKKAFYVPLRKGNRIIHVREDLLDTLHDDEFEQVLSEAEDIEEMMNEGNVYLGDKASRQAKKAARQERRETRKQQKTDKSQLKNERKAAKNDVIKSKAELKRARGEAKITKAKNKDPNKSWIDDVKDVAGAVGGVVGAFTGKGAASDEAEEMPTDPMTGEIVGGDASNRIGVSVAKKSKTGLYIGIGAGALVLVGILAFVASKKKK